MPTLFRDIVQIGDVVFNDPSDMPVGAVRWGVDVMDGWDDSTDMDVFTAPRGGGADGEIAGGYFSSKGRHLILGGFAECEDRAAAESCIDVIKRDVFPSNTDITLVRSEPIPKWLSVRVAGRISTPRTIPHAFRWTAEVFAEMPFKYSVGYIGGSAGVTAGVAGQSGAARTYPRVYPLVYAIDPSTAANTTAIINNVGTAYSLPIVRLYGPLDQGGWRLTTDRSDAYLRFDVGLLADDVLDIDFASGTARKNGQLVTATISGDFFRIEPGVNTLRLYADYAPTAGLSVYAYSAWK